MWSAFRFLFRWQIFKPIIQPILRPLFRVLMGLIAIPIFRFLMRKIFRVQELDDELEKDLEQWFKATLVLLAATKNMEMAIFGFLFSGEVGVDDFQNPWVTGMRIMMAIGVIEMMPDQELFAIIHPGPPRLKYDRKKGLWKCIREQSYPFLKGVACQHLNRSSPVFAILCAIFHGTAGWICFGLAITQYLIIGLVTSRDRALDALSEFDRQVAIKRQELRQEFGLDEDDEVPETSQSPAPDSIVEHEVENKTEPPISDGKPGELAKDIP